MVVLHHTKLKKVDIEDVKELEISYKDAFLSRLKVKEKLIKFTPSTEVYKHIEDHEKVIKQIFLKQNHKVLEIQNVCQNSLYSRFQTALKRLETVSFLYNLSQRNLKFVFMEQVKRI